MSSWWRTDEYEGDFAVPQEFHNLAGPKGLALVKVNSNGSTQEGWGLTGRDGADGFIPRYQRGEFAHRRALHQYTHDGRPFAVVMRSVQMVCVDIDGKNGGFEHAKELGLVVPTMAETSKSGNGYHLFYRAPDEWSDTAGFARYSDAIGIVQGVDIRATGCVYHYPSQHWNDRPLADLPKFLKDKLTQREQKKQATKARTLAISTLDETEKIMMHDELITELKKPIPAGKRNNTLFAIGSQMKEAGVLDWEDKVQDRAVQVGLDYDEAEKLVRNIGAYAA